jgi:hypothetical protein
MPLLRVLGERFVFQAHTKYRGPDRKPTCQATANSFAPPLVTTRIIFWPWFCVN